MEAIYFQSIAVSTVVMPVPEFSQFSVCCESSRFFLATSTSATIYAILREFFPTMPPSDMPIEAILLPHALLLVLEADRNL